MTDSQIAQPETTARQGWGATTRLVVGILLIVLAAIALRSFRAIIVPLIISTIMAYLLHPLVTSVSRLTHIPHKVATAIIYLILLVGVILIGIALTPVVVEQVTLLRRELVRIINDLLSLSSQSITIMDFEVEVQTIVDEVGLALQEFVRATATDVVGFAVDVAETTLLVIFVFLMAFYLTRDAREFRAWFRGLIPPGYQSDSDRLLTELNEVWSAFFRGQLTLAVVVAFIVTIVASIIGLPQPLFWGLFAGLMEFLPSVGHAIYIIVAGIVAFIEGSTTLPISNLAFVVVVAGVHVVFTQIDLNFLIPRIIGGQIHLHPMVVIIGIIIGASVGGVLGVALAAPVIASLRVLGRYVRAQLFGLDPFPDADADVEAPRPAPTPKGAGTDAGAEQPAGEPA